MTSKCCPAPHLPVLTDTKPWQRVELSPNGMCGRAQLCWCPTQGPVHCLLHLMCQVSGAFGMAAIVRGFLLLHSRPWLLHAAEWPVSTD